jgi:hypothetical protein
MEIREAKRIEGLYRQQYLALTLARHFGDGIRSSELDAAAARWAGAVQVVQQLESAERLGRVSAALA